MPAQSQQHELHNRYPGVKPFTSAERELFFGRDKDIEDLYSLLFIKQSIVLYGKSGYGKSSLLNAGVIPRLLEEDEWICFPIRFNNYSERDSKGNVSPLENIKLHLKMDLGENATSFIDEIMPDEDSLWYWVKVLQSVQGKSQFIFFFDQFEELFTYPKVHIEEFSEQLSQLLYNTVPVKYRKRLAEMDEKEEVSDALHHQLFEKLEVKVVFSVRSDRLSMLNTLTDKHPTILQNYYELNALSGAEAEQAIIKPSMAPQSNGFSTPPFDYTKEALTKILDGISNLQDGKIETSTLQIVCRYVEDTLVAERKITSITAELLGNIANIFKEYYEGVLAKLNANDRGKVQHLIEDELIEEGRRNTLTDSYIRNRFGFDEKLLWQLEQSSLLRKERDAAGRILYEISHDKLVNAIDMVAQGRRRIEDENKRSILEQTLATEQEKARHLTDLNRKVVFRSRLATALAAISLIVAGMAAYFWQESKTAWEHAKMEESNAKMVSLLRFRISLQQAQKLEEDVKAYLLSSDYDLAFRSINLADSLLAVNGELPAPEESERKVLKSVIENDKKAYEQAVKK